MTEDELRRIGVEHGHQPHVRALLAYVRELHAEVVKYRKDEDQRSRCPGCGDRLDGPHHSGCGNGYGDWSG